MLEFEKSEDKQMRSIMESIEALSGRVESIESISGGIPCHLHTGIDSPKIRISDLNTVLYAGTTMDVGSLADGVGTTISIPVTGAQYGDFTLASAPGSVGNVVISSYVGTTNIVDIRVQNESGSTVDLASGTWRVIVIKRFN